ncbi:MAG: glycine oxidase ThiO [Solirubrobacterales bacterium]|nr:glycine oxidase ThiO [Solirubrobacterales bacterium]
MDLAYKDDKQSPDLAVVGGGVIGLAIAWRAAQAGMKVTLFERGELGGEASNVAAGMLAPVAEASLAEQEILALGRQSAALWPEFARQLSASCGLDSSFQECGTLMVATDRDQAVALDREFVLRQSLSLPVQRLRPSQARQLEPGLAPSIHAALNIPGDHTVDPRALTAALSAAAADAGAKLASNTAVAGLLGSADAITGVTLASGEEVSAGAVVVAAGSWSGQLEGIPAQAKIPVRPVKGQILRLRDPAGPGLATRVLRTDEVYVVPRGDGRYVVGATMEELGFDTTVTAGAVYELLRAAAELLPGVWELELQEASAGLRPSTPDNAPVIGPSLVPGLHWATGHHRNGILLAPITADLLLAALQSGELADSASAFTAKRFASRVLA